MNEIEAIRYLRKKTGCYVYIGHEFIHAIFGGKAYRGATFVDLAMMLQLDDPKAPVVELRKKTRP